jgi:hypothetical protein
VSTFKVLFLALVMVTTTINSAMSQANFFKASRSDLNAPPYIQFGGDDRAVCAIMQGYVPTGHPFYTAEIARIDQCAKEAQDSGVSLTSNDIWNCEYVTGSIHFCVNAAKRKDPFLDMFRNDFTNYYQCLKDFDLKPGALRNANFPYNRRNNTRTERNQDIVVSVLAGEDSPICRGADYVSFNFDNVDYRKCMKHFKAKDYPHYYSDSRHIQTVKLCMKLSKTEEGKQKIAGIIQAETARNDYENSFKGWYDSAVEYTNTVILE